MRHRTPLVAALAALLLAGVAHAQAGPEEPRPRQQAVYVPAYRYPVLEQIEAARAAAQATRDSLQEEVDVRYRAEDARQEEEERSLRADWNGVEVPSGPDAFQTPFYFPPLPQYNTGTCWSYCSTSFLEAEIARLSGRRIKLSEMWTVYWEYVEKARRFVREYGHSPIAEGSQDHGAIEIGKRYGAVPAEAYAGVLSADGRHDHAPLVEEIDSYLRWMRENRYWDEEKAIAHVRMILDRHLGRPPERFVFAGRQWTPKEFLRDHLKLDLDAYVNLVSSLKEPFGGYVLLDVPDNWRRKEDYLNLPLETWYRVLREAVADGYTVSIGGDVSEPGLDGMHDAAIVPTFDIPSAYIDQSAREFRIANRTTGDDHGVHVVGVLRRDGRDWFLVKDSNRSSRLGKHEGYYFYDGDYVRLKMLSFMVHKDRLKGLLP